MEIKDLHELLLQLLVDFNALCLDYGIKYTLHGGTLLGAIREKGFIPWDDDADVAMTRAEYEKLRSCLEQKASHYYLRGKIKVQFCDRNHPDVWVDIFICDYISEKSISRKIKIGLLTVLDVMLRDKESMKYSNLEKYSKTKQLCYKTIFAVGQNISRRFKQRVYLHVSQKFFIGNMKNYIRSNDQYVGRKIVMPTIWMAEFIEVPFENKKLLVTQYYDKLLTSSYGSNYMTPIKDTRNSAVHEQIRNTEGGFKL